MFPSCRDRTFQFTWTECSYYRCSQFDYTISFAVYYSFSLATDCLQCWSDACSGALLPESVRDECCDQCMPEGDCCATPFRASETCCSTTESSILSVFTVDSSEESEVCSSSSIYLGALELDLVYSGQTLQPGTYVMPNLTFSCSGCIDEVVVRGEDSSIPENVEIELLFWARYDPPEGENELHKILRRVPISTDNVVRNPDDLNVFNVNFNLSENKVCFTDREVFGFSSEGSGDPAVQLTPGSDQSVQVYQVTHPTDNNCSNLAEYADLSSSEAHSGVPVISLRISKLLIIWSPDYHG